MIFLWKWIKNLRKIMNQPTEQRGIFLKLLSKHFKFSCLALNEKIGI